MASNPAGSAYSALKAWECPQHSEHRNMHFSRLMPWGTVLLAWHDALGYKEAWLCCFAEISPEHFLKGWNDFNLFFHSGSVLCQHPALQAGVQFRLYLNPSKASLCLKHRYVLALTCWVVIWTSECFLGTSRTQMWEQILQLHFRGVALPTFYLKSMMRCYDYVGQPNSSVFLVFQMVTLKTNCI